MQNVVTADVINSSPLYYDGVVPFDRITTLWTAWKDLEYWHDSHYPGCT